tara:strand:- start:811 stop:987 length:177 start_codon:yes stop_codon:yes gene_type:complete
MTKTEAERVKEWMAKRYVAVEDMTYMQLISAECYRCSDEDRKVIRAEMKRRGMIDSVD